MAHRCNRRLTSPWRHCWRARIHDRPANRRHSSSKLTAGTTHRESRPFSRQVGAGRNDDEAAWYPSVRGTLTIWPTGCRLDVDHACMSPCTYYIYQMKDVLTVSVGHCDGMPRWLHRPWRTGGNGASYTPRAQLWLTVQCRSGEIFLYRLNEWNRKFVRNRTILSAKKMYISKRETGGNVQVALTPVGG